MLTGLIEPSEGQIFYQGRSVHDDFTAFQRRIGYVPEEAHLYPHLTGREYLQLCGRLRGMPRRALEPKMDEFLRAFTLWNDRHAPLSSYSKGMRQKILLSAALLHDPDILILDEPFSGLDVTSALMLRSLLRSLAGRGKIVLYSSHVLEVVEKVCSKVLILRNGEVVAYDSIEHLRELMQQPSLEGVFAQLTQVDDGEEVANRILDAMSSAPSGGRVPGSPVAAGLRVYRGMANAFPQEFQNAYGPELLRDRRRRHRAHLAPPRHVRTGAPAARYRGPRTARVRRRVRQGRTLLVSPADRFARIHRRGAALAGAGHLHRDLRVQRDERHGAARHSRRSKPRGNWSLCNCPRLTRITGAIANAATCSLPPWPTSPRCRSRSRWASTPRANGASSSRPPTSPPWASIRRSAASRARARRPAERSRWW